MSDALTRIQKFVPDVSKVIDAKRDLFIEVTKHDDKAGKKGKHQECALAVACKRKYNADSVLISRSTAYIIKGKKATRFHLPSTVSREITSFDRGAGFEPGVYELHRPSTKLTGKKHGGKAPNHSKRDNSRPKRFIHRTSNIRFSLSEAI